MTDHVAAIFKQAGIQIKADGGYIGDRRVFPVSGGSPDDGVDLTQIILATDLQKIIAREVGQIADFGFVHVHRIVCRVNWISIGYRSIIADNRLADINIIIGGISIGVLCDGIYYDTLWQFERLDKEYARQLAAAKNHRAAVIEAVAALLPQPIAEEIVPEVCLSI